MEPKDTKPTPAGLLIAIKSEDWQSIRLSSSNAFEAIYELLYEVYYKLGEKELRTEGRTILIDLGPNDLGRPGPAGKLSQIEGVHIIGEHQIIQTLRTAIGLHSAGLGSKRDFITVLVTNRSDNDLLREYTRSVSGIVLHFADLGYSVPAASSREIIEVGMDEYGTYRHRPRHNTGSKSDTRSPHEIRKTDISDDSDSVAPLSLAESNGGKGLGSFPFPIIHPRRTLSTSSHDHLVVRAIPA